MAKQHLKHYPLGESQKDFYFWELIDKKEIVTNHWFVIGEGYFDNSHSFNADALEKAYFELLRRNDAFRMRLTGSKLIPRQVFIDVSEFPKPERINLSGGYDAFKKLCDEPAYPEMTIYDDFLTRATIYCCDDGTGGIVILQHHVCSDGYSMDFLGYKQLCEFYDCYKTGTTPPEPKKTFSFSQYLEWEKKDLKKNRFKYLHWILKEWDHHFSRHYTPTESDINEQVTCIEIKGDYYHANKEMFSNTNTYMAAMAVLAHSFLPEKDFNFFSETHGRMNYAQKNTCGPLLSEVPVFYTIKDTDKLSDILLYTFNKLLEAYFNYKLNDLISGCFCMLHHPCVVLQANTNHWMLFNNLKGYRNIESYSLTLLEIKQPTPPDKFEMNIWDLASEEGVLIEFVYDGNWTDADTIEKLKKQYMAIFDLICTNPDMTVGECLKSIQIKVAEEGSV